MLCSNAHAFRISRHNTNRWPWLQHLNIIIWKIKKKVTKLINRMPWDFEFRFSFNLCNSWVAALNDFALFSNIGYLVTLIGESAVNLTDPTVHSCSWTWCRTATDSMSPIQISVRLQNVIFKIISCWMFYSISQKKIVCLYCLQATPQSATLNESSVFNNSS